MVEYYIIININVSKEDWKIWKIIHENYMLYNPPGELNGGNIKKYKYKLPQFNLKCIKSTLKVIYLLIEWVIFFILFSIFKISKFS